jgi:hypothetical protein
LLISGVIAIASLPVAAATIGVIGLLGAAGFLRWIPAFVPRGKDDTARDDTAR